MDGSESMDLVALGEPLLELNAPQGHDLASARQFAVGYGGDTSNVIIAAARSGAATGYVTHLGDDRFGSAFVDLWEREGVDVSGVVRRPGGRTGVYFISRDPAHSSFTYYRAGSPASLMGPADIPEHFIRSANALHVSGITQAISTSSCDAAFHAMRVAKDAGRLISYDPNHRAALWATDRARAVVAASVEICDVALPNLEEGRLLSGAEDPADVLDWFVRRGPTIVALTMGADGALVHHDGTTVHAPAHQVEPVDSTGAGDAFDGSFLARLLKGDSPIQATRYAVVAAALTTRGYGAVEPIPDREAVLAQIRDHHSTTASS